MKMSFYATMIVGVSLFHVPILASGNANPSDEPQYQGELPTGQTGAGQGATGVKMKSNNQKGIIIETGIVVQGGKTAGGAPGANTPSPGNKNGIIVIGGKTPGSDPAALGASTTAIGPKQDEPTPPPPNELGGSSRILPGQ